MNDHGGRAETEHTNDWHVTIHLYEDRAETGARAVLSAENRELVGHGEAHRNPYDSDVPRIGDELAAGRALMDLGRQLLRETEHDIEMVMGQPVHLSK